MKAQIDNSPSPGSKQGAWTFEAAMQPDALLCLTVF